MDYHKYRYNFTIENRKIANVSGKDGLINFKKPVTENKLNKIYVIKYNKEIIYIGITKQSIRNRLRYGLIPQNNRTGYHGYKWKELNGNFEIDIFVFEKEISLEGLEGEIVFKFRTDLNKWPKYQHEIHFHNISKEEIKIAEQIYYDANKKDED
jgi:hypothetical protein